MTSRSCQYRLASQEEERDKEKLGLNFPSPSWTPAPCDQPFSSTPLTHEDGLSFLLDKEELAPVSAACLYTEYHKVASGEHPQVGRQQQLL